MKQKLIKRCTELGVMLHDDGGSIKITCPQGHTLGGQDIHYFDLWLDGWQRKDAYAYILTELSLGIDKCSIDNCEYCSCTEEHSFVGMERLA